MSVVVKVIVQIVSLNLHPDLIVFFQVQHGLEVQRQITIEAIASPDRIPVQIKP
jgi:hypothetical protein